MSAKFKKGPRESDALDAACHRMARATGQGEQEIRQMLALQLHFAAEQLELRKRSDKRKTESAIDDAVRRGMEET